MNIEEDRLKRYRDKIEVILNRIAEIREWSGISTKDFINDE